MKLNLNEKLKYKCNIINKLNERMIYIKY